jgi:formylglycine-generating enzyme required for sulfatase activity
MMHRDNKSISLFLILCLAALISGCATQAAGVTESVILSFKPSGGTYYGRQAVALSAEKGAAIYYTLDGTEPTALDGIPYPVSDDAKKPATIDVNRSLTIKAIAVKAIARGESGKAGPVASAKYLIMEKAPTIEKYAEAAAPAGTLLARLLAANSEARIRYTLDGSLPTKVYGTEYAGIPVLVKKGQTLRAVAFRSEWEQSALAEKNFDEEIQPKPILAPEAVSPPAATETPIPLVLQLAAPRFSPEPGTYPEPVTVSLVAGSEADKIRYSADGKDPNGDSGLLYDTAFRIESSRTIKAVALGADSRISKVAVGEFLITGTVAAPVLSPSAGRYTPDRSVSMSCATQGATIRYSLDGRIPAAGQGSVYSSPFQAKGSVTIAAIASKAGWKDSPATIASFTFVDAPEMVLVLGSNFNMGSASGEPDEKPTHPVTLSTFYIGKHEITQAQYLSVMSANPSFFSSGFDAPSRPVEQVSWLNAVGFCNSLSDVAGLPRVYSVSGTSVVADFSKTGYRLPTEAEWEFAARGGMPGTIAGSPVMKYSGSDDADAVSWNLKNSGGGTRAEGTKAANGLGLYDMTGNVWEWCYDWYGIYPAITGKPQIDPKGPATGTMRVKRGGSWNRMPDFSRVSFRNYHNPLNNDRTIGFRVARSVIQ